MRLFSRAQTRLHSYLVLDVITGTHDVTKRKQKNNYRLQFQLSNQYEAVIIAEKFERKSI